MKEVFLSSARMMLVVVFACIAGICVSHAAPPTGSGTTLAPWFSDLKIPGTNGSCCSMSDCRPVVIRPADGHYQAFISKKEFGSAAPNDWVNIPSYAELKQHDNPVGEPIVCWIPGRGVLCFVDASKT